MIRLSAKAIFSFILLLIASTVMGSQCLAQCIEFTESKMPEAPIWAVEESLLPEGLSIGSTYEAAPTFIVHKICLPNSQTPPTGYKYMTHALFEIKPPGVMPAFNSSASQWRWTNLYSTVKYEKQGSGPGFLYFAKPLWPDPSQ